MSEVLPTLSSSGWVTGVQEKADRLMSYFLVSQYSSSHTYHGLISSLPYLIKTHQSDYGGLGSAVEQTLHSLYKGYFDSAVFNVSVEPVADSDAIYNIRIDGIVTSGGLKHSLGRLIEASNTTISNIKLINE